MRESTRQLLTVKISEKHYIYTCTHTSLTMSMLHCSSVRALMRACLETHARTLSGLTPKLNMSMAMYQCGVFKGEQMDVDMNIGWR